MLKEGITILIAFSGVLFGLLLTKVTENEIRPGRKYFVWAMKNVLLVLVVLLLYYSWISYWIIVSFVLGFILARYFRVRYFYLGLALVGGLLVSLEVFLIIASLVFVYGVVFGTLFEKRKILFELVLFLVPFLLLLIPNVGSYSYLILSFVAGSLFLRK